MGGTGDTELYKTYPGLRPVSRDSEILGRQCPLLLLSGQRLSLHPTPVPLLPNWSLPCESVLTPAPSLERPTGCLLKKRFGWNRPLTSIAPCSFSENPKLLRGNQGPSKSGHSPAGVPLTPQDKSHLFLPAPPPLPLPKPPPPRLPGSPVSPTPSAAAAQPHLAHQVSSDTSRQLMLLFPQNLVSALILALTGHIISYHRIPALHALPTAS